MPCAKAHDSYQNIIFGKLKIHSSFRIFTFQNDLPTDQICGTTYAKFPLCLLLHCTYGNGHIFDEKYANMRQKR